MSEKLPKMPEPAAWRRICNRHSGAAFWSYTESKVFDGDEPIYTASQVLSLQRDTWMRAMEVAAKIAEEAVVPTFLHGYQTFDDGILHGEQIAAAIRALPMPEGGE
jgi:hypothetical protein